MKTILSFLPLVLALLISQLSEAAIKGAPFIPEVDYRFNALETGISGLYGDIGSPDITSRIVVSLNGLSTTGGAISTGIVLPPNSILYQSFYDLKAVPTPAGAKFAFQCLNAGDVVATTDKSGFTAGQLFNGQLIDSAGAGAQDTAIINTTTTGCTIKIVPSGPPATGGVIDLFVQYVLAK